MPSVLSIISGGCAATGQRIGTGSVLKALRRALLVMSEIGLQGLDGKTQDNYTLKNTRWPHAFSLAQPETGASVVVRFLMFGGYNTQ